MHARSRIALHSALTGLVLCFSAQAAHAQQALAPRTPPVDVAASTRVAGPTVDAARAGVSRQTSQELRVPAAPRRAGMGQPVALMVVGGAALLTGLIIGGDAGTVIAVGGTLVGLYGLYEYLQ
jgi:predicted phage tail protein